MGIVQSIDVYLPEMPREDFDQDLQVWLYHEYGIDAVCVSVELDSYGRVIDHPFAIVWLYPHPTRTRATELDEQEKVAAAISKYVGYPVPLWSANPYRSAGAVLADQRWTAQGPLTCTICNATFEGKTGRKGLRYCSSACRQKGYRARLAPRA